MSGLRRRTHEILENASDRPVARLVNRLLIGLIILNVLAILLASVTPIAARYHAWLLGFEWFSILVFTVEYLARVWAAVEHRDVRYQAPLMGRIRYMLRPLPLVDLLAILPFYLAFLMPVDLRFMRIFRLFLIFKLTRYHASMSLLSRVIRNEARPIAAALFVLATLLTVAASFAFIAEHEAQPDKFASIPDAMWWAIVTMTTVGYGDVAPQTPLGQMLASMLMIVGYGVLAVPTGIVTLELQRAARGRRTRECPGCGSRAQDEDASYCKYCGTQL